jgi:hypothetical protein
MEEAKLAVSVAAVLLSLASFGIAQRSAAKARKKETLTHLLGDKETVSYAALLLSRRFSKRAYWRVLIVRAPSSTQ